MSASQKGHVECVKMLADRGAEVNMQKKVSGVIIDRYMQCSIHPESAVVYGDVCV